MIENTGVPGLEQPSGDPGAERNADPILRLPPEARAPAGFPAWRESWYAARAAELAEAMAYAKLDRITLAGGMVESVSVPGIVFGWLVEKLEAMRAQLQKRGAQVTDRELQHMAARWWARLCTDVHSGSPNDRTWGELRGAMAWLRGNVAAKAVATGRGEFDALLSGARKGEPVRFPRVAASEADVLGAGGPQPIEADCFDEPFDPLDEVTVPAFPVEALPTWLGDYVKAEAEATQTPPDLAGLLALAAIATVCAKRARVKVRDGWSEPVNVCVAVGLPPGARKSPVFADVSAPLTEWECEAGELARPNVARALEEIEQLKARIARLRTKVAKDGDADAVREAGDLAVQLAEREATAPTAPRLLTDDCTPETLAGLLERQGGRMSVWSPEGGELFEMMRGRYSGNARPNLGVYLQGHAGDRLSVDRKRGHVHVEAPALTVACAVQPAVIRGLRDERTFRERGLLARFVYAVPTSTVGARDWEVAPVPDAVAAAYRENLHRLLHLPGSERTIGLERDAYDALGVFARDLEPRLAENGDLGGMADWAGKLAGLVVRFAGLLHVAQWAEADPFAQPIDRTTMERALALGRYALEHARAAFATIGGDERTEGALKIWRHLAKRSVVETTKREIWQWCKGGRFEKAEDLDPCIGLLCERGYLRTIGENGGTRTERYGVNRRALGGVGGVLQEAGESKERGEERKFPLVSTRNAPSPPNHGEQT